MLFKAVEKVGNGLKKKIETAFYFVRWCYFGHTEYCMQEITNFWSYRSENVLKIWTVCDASQVVSPSLDLKYWNLSFVILFFQTWSHPVWGNCRNPMPSTTLTMHSRSQRKNWVSQGSWIRRVTITSSSYKAHIRKHIHIYLCSLNDYLLSEKN